MRGGRVSVVVFSVVAVLWSVSLVLASQPMVLVRSGESEKVSVGTWACAAGDANIRLNPLADLLRGEVAALFQDVHFNVSRPSGLLRAPDHHVFARMERSTLCKLGSLVVWGVEALISATTSADTTANVADGGRDRGQGYNSTVTTIASFLYLALNSQCPDCSSASVFGVGESGENLGAGACAIECDAIHADGSCSVSFSPFSRPCVLSSSDAPGEVIAMKVSVSRFYLVNLILGIFLVSVGRPLSSSRWFHLLFGACLGFVSAVLVVMYFIWKQAQNMMPRQIAEATNLALVAIPITGTLAVRGALPYLLRTTREFVAMAMLHPVGQVYFGLSAVLGVLWVWRFRVFLPAKSEAQQLLEKRRRMEKIAGSNGHSGIGLDADGDGHADGEAEDLNAPRRFVRHAFRIAADGSRVDEVDPERPWSQALLHALVAGPGVALLLFSTSSFFVSFSLTGIALAWDAISFVAWQYRMYMDSVDPATLRPLLNEEQYNKQTVDHTKLQLEKLRAFLKENPDQVMSTHPSTAELVRRFRAGKPHYRAPGAAEPRPSLPRRLRVLAINIVGTVAAVAAAGASVLLIAALIGPAAMPAEIGTLLAASGIEPVLADLRAVLLGQEWL